jgi:hypothetical protein
MILPFDGRGSLLSDPQHNEAPTGATGALNQPVDSLKAYAQTQSRFSGVCCSIHPKYELDWETVLVRGTSVAVQFGHVAAKILGCKRGYREGGPCHVANSKWIRGIQHRAAVTCGPAAPERRAAA